MKRRLGALGLFLLLGGAAGAQPAAITGNASIEAIRFIEGLTDENRFAATGALEIKAEKSMPNLFLTGSFRLRESSDGDYRWRIDPADREIEPSAISLREARARFSPSPNLDLEAGRFELGWGKTDGYSPADSFLPRDLTDPFTDEKLGLWGVRATGQSGNLRGELVISPLTTPWRVPEPGSRYLPLPFPENLAADAGGEPPEGGFIVMRTLSNVEEWDFGFWARTGVLPAPWLEFVPTSAGIAPTRRFTRETGAGAELSRLVGPIVARAEGAFLDPTSKEVGNSLVASLGIEAPFDEGTLLLTWAKAYTSGGQEDATPLDRALLPLLVAALHWEPEWGACRVVWTSGLEHGDGLVKLEGSYSLTDNLKPTIELDLPYGPRTGPFGRLRDASRLDLGLEYSW